MPLPPAGPAPPGATLFVAPGCAAAADGAAAFPRRRAGGGAADSDSSASGRRRYSGRVLECTHSRKTASRFKAAFLSTRVVTAAAQTQHRKQEEQDVLGDGDGLILEPPSQVPPPPPPTPWHPPPYPHTMTGRQAVQHHTPLAWYGVQAAHTPGLSTTFTPQTHQLQCTCLSRLMMPHFFVHSLSRGLPGTLTSGTRHSWHI